MLNRFDVTFTLQGPILSGSNEMGGFGVDSPISRNSAGLPYFAGSHILGKLRQAMNDYKFLKMDIFGGQTSKEDDQTSILREDDQTSIRRKIFFTDFISSSQGSLTQTRTRIALENGVVKQGMLQVIEEPYHSNETVCFKGEMIVLNGVDNMPLKKALRAIVQLGGNRSTGFGRVLNVAVTPHIETIQDIETIQEKVVGENFIYELEITDPLLVGEKRMSDNTFTSSYYISGAAIKGTLAFMNSHICELENVVISHAFPKKKDPAPLRPLPLSMCFKDENGTPRYQPDWKDADWEKAYGGIKSPARQLRVRTAIEYETRIAKETALFAYDMVETDKHIWCGTIHIPKESQATFFETIKDGLIGLGKTQNFAKMTLKPRTLVSKKILKGSKFSLFLLTPALIRVGEEDYATAFKDIFPTLDLCMEDCYFQEYYAGGEFIAKKQGAVYNPYLLTKEGSTFVFIATEEFEVPQFLGLRKTIADELGANPWNKCVYLPNNGFGQVEILS
jgi:hypothetical protein